MLRGFLLVMLQEKQDEVFIDSKQPPSGVLLQLAQSAF